MAKAMVLCIRTAEGGWKPVTAYLATRNRLSVKTLPGSAARESHLRELRNAKMPTPASDGSPRTWEDWLEQVALDAYSNGHTTWTVMRPPTLTVDELYDRDVLGIDPRPLTRPDLQPTTVAPLDLGGYRKVKP